MNNVNIELARLKMKELEKLRVQEKELKKAVSYLPEKYDEKLIKQTILKLEDEIERLSDILSDINEKIELLKQTGESLEKIVLLNI